MMPAALVREQGVLGLAGRDPVEVVREQALEQLDCARPLDLELAHVRHVERAAVLAHRDGARGSRPRTAPASPTPRTAPSARRARRGGRGAAFGAACLRDPASTCRMLAARLAGRAEEAPCLTGRAGTTARRAPPSGTSNRSCGRSDARRSAARSRGPRAEIGRLALPRAGGASADAEARRDHGHPHLVLQRLVDDGAEDDVRVLRPPPR